jgi:hypothetical protein
MSPLFDNEDWSRSGGADVPLPSFLRDDAPNIPGPSDVSFTFQPQGPTYERVAAASWPAQAGYSARGVAAGHSAGYPASGYAASGLPGHAYPMPPAPMAAPYEPPEPYGERSYGEPSYGEHAYGEPAYGESSYGQPTEVAGSSSWDPLFDPWPAPGGPASAVEPDWSLPMQPGWDELPSDHPSGPLPRTPAGPDPMVEDYEVTLTGALGYADLGFRAGQWYSLGGTVPRPISTRDALRAHPDLGGPIVQVVCLWMRENAHDPRALDLATELAFAVGELSREAARIPR